MNPGAACPISLETVDHNASRVTCGLTIVALASLSILALAFPELRSITWVVAVALTVDYAMRAWMPWPSPLQRLGSALAAGLGIPRRPSDKAPKRFACRIGFLFAVAIVVLMPTSSELAVAVAGALVFFNVLDGVFDFCVGCWMYSLLAPFRNVAP